MNNELTIKQTLFVANYCLTKNGTQSAIDAGYSPISASQIAIENMGKPMIARAIDRKLNKVLKKIDVSVERIAEELAKLGFSNMGDCYDINGELIPIHLLPREVSAAITEVTQTVDKHGKKSVRYKMDGKTKNLELLGRYHQMFVDKIEVTTRDELYSSIVANASSHPKNAIKQRILEHDAEDRLSRE